jgi:hypothetical protein
MDKPFVIVRTYSAGVHFGYLESREGKEVTLSNARRIWRWQGAYTLNEIATKGLDVNYSKISVPVQSIVLTEAIEIISVSSEAQAILESGTWIP